MVKYTLLFFFILSVNAMANVELLADPTKPLNYQIKAVNKKQRSALPKLQNIVTKAQQRQTIISHVAPNHSNMPGSTRQ